MATYLLLVVALMTALVALPLLDPASYDAPPVIAWALLAIGALVMAFRGRRKG
jgi:hypothetical protein